MCRQGDGYLTQLLCCETSCAAATSDAIPAASIPPQDSIATGHILPAKFYIEACAAVIEDDLDLKADTLPQEYDDPEF